MTIYFYDDKELSLIAVDTDTKVARILRQAVFGPDGPAPADKTPASKTVTETTSYFTPEPTVGHAHYRFVSQVTVEERVAGQLDWFERLPVTAFSDCDSPTARSI